MNPTTRTIAMTIWGAAKAMEEWECRTCHNRYPATKEYFVSGKGGRLSHWCKTCKLDWEREYRTKKGLTHRVNLTRESMALLLYEVIREMRLERNRQIEDECGVNRPTTERAWRGSVVRAKARTNESPARYYQQRECKRRIEGEQNSCQHR